MILVKGSGATSGELPIGMGEARAYFQAVPDFLLKIEAVSTVKPLSRPGAYMVLHHPIGALGYTVTVVACLQAEWDDGGLRLRPLDFDPAQVRCEHTVVKGYIESDLRLTERQAERTAADFRFEVTVEVPVPGPLRLMPKGLLQATSDGLMTIKAGLVVESLFRKVLDDFRLPVEAVKA